MAQGALIVSAPDATAVVIVGLAYIIFGITMYVIWRDSKALTLTEREDENDAS